MSIFARVTEWLRAAFVLLVELFIGVLRLLGVLIDLVSPSFALVDYLFDQRLLAVFPAWRFRYAFWASIFSLATLVVGIHLAENKYRAHAPGRIIGMGMLTIVGSFALGHIYLGVFGEFSDYVQTTQLTGSPHEWRMAGWSVLLLSVYVGAFALLTLGLTFLGMFAYHDAIGKLKAK